MIEAYARYWTEDELRALHAFYHSPLGTRLRAFFPYLAGEMAAAASNVRQRHSDEVARIIRESALRENDD